MGASGCLDDDAVVSLLEGTLGAEERALLEQHLDTCAACRVLLSSALEGEPATERRPPPFELDAEGDHSARRPWTRWPPGTRLEERFDLEAFVGSGGMGDVYRARDLQTDAPVAIKVIRDLELENVARFERERALLAELRHPSIVRYVAQGHTPDATPFLAMEWLEGEELATKLARGPLNVEATLTLGRRIADGLGRAHAAGITHRDIKPSNIFLLGGRESAATILDFGVARARRVGRDFSTRTGTIVGTIGYMAPEQARAGRTVDARADVFSLGCVLYECLTGVRATRGTNPVEMLADLLSGQVAPVRNLLPAVPPALDELIERMTAKDPALRPVDGAAVAAELAALARTGPRVSARRRMAVTVRRRWLAALGTLALGTAMAAGGLIALRGWRARAGGHLAPTAVFVTPSADGGAGGSGAAAQPTTVLILGILNETPSPLLTGTVDEIFRSALDRAGDTSPVRVSQLATVAAEVSGADAAKPALDEHLGPPLAAKRGGRVVALRGAISPNAAGYTVSVTFADVSATADGPVLLHAREDASDGMHVVSAVARVIVRMRAALGLPPLGADEAERTGMSTSLEADSEFVLGRGLGDNGDNVGGSAHLARAIALDPFFAKAHFIVAAYLENQGRGREAWREMELAYDERDQLSERERLNVRTDFFDRTGEYGQEIALLTEYLPHARAKSNVLGRISSSYWHARDVESAIRFDQQALAADPDNVIAHANMANYLLATGHFEEASAETRASIARFPNPTEDAYIYDALARALLGDDAGAIASYKKLTSALSSAAGIADLAIARVHPEEAEKALETSLATDAAKNDPQLAAASWATLAELRLQRGAVSEAIAPAEKAAAAGEAASVYVAGRVLLAAKKVARVTELAAQLAQGRLMDERFYALLLSAEVKRAQGDGRGALALLEQAKAKRDVWIVHFALAGALADAGDPRGAGGELSLCEARRGEGAVSALTEDAPGLRYLARAMSLRDSLRR